MLFVFLQRVFHVDSKQSPHGRRRQLLFEEDLQLSVQEDVSLEKLVEKKNTSYEVQTETRNKKEGMVRMNHVKRKGRTMLRPRQRKTNERRRILKLTEKNKERQG